jgi:ribosomal protein S18 acetylase RimI-like enzyme
MRLGIYQDLRSRLLSNSPNHACLVGVQKRSARQAPAQGWVVGTVEVTLRPLSPWQSYALKSPYISNLAVKTNCRRQGIAQRLLLACERTVREWGLQDLYLHVLDNNQPALQLYLKAGYQLQEADPLWTTYFFKRPRRLLLHKQLR